MIADAVARASRGRVIAVAALLAAACGAGPAAAAQYTLRLSSWGSPAAPQVSAYVPLFKKLVEEGSKGRIAVQTFAAGALVKEQDVPSAIQSRVVDISLSTIGSWASVSKPAALVNSILFRPTNRSFQQLAGVGSPLFKALDRSLGKRDVVLLSVLDNEPPMVVSRRKITKPQDFKGKAIRVYDKASSEIIHTLGGAPSTIGVADVYAALQRGTVQAAIGGIQGITGLKEYEVAKYLLNGNGVWGVGVTMYVMNGAAFKELPPDLQQVVRDAGARAEKATNEAIFAFFGKALATLKGHGMVVTTLEPGTPPYRAFADALAPLAKKQQANIPAELLHLVSGEQH